MMLNVPFTIMSEWKITSIVPVSKYYAIFYLVVLFRWTFYLCVYESTHIVLDTTLSKWIFRTSGLSLCHVDMNLNEMFVTVGHLFTRILFKWSLKQFPNNNKNFFLLVSSKQIWFEFKCNFYICSQKVSSWLKWFFFFLVFLFFFLN